MQIGNLKWQFAIENTTFNRFRFVLVDSCNSLRLPPILCMEHFWQPKRSWKSSVMCNTYTWIYRNFKSPSMTKATKWPVHRAKTQISLGIRPVWTVFPVRMKKPWVQGYPLSIQQRFWSDWVDAQADLSLCWVHRSSCWFCHALAQLYYNTWTQFSVLVHKKWALLRENLSSGFFYQGRHKLACAGTEVSHRLEISDIETGGIILSKQWTTKVLIRLRGCAGWSAPLLFA